jgi:hypothetical protein
VPFTLAGASLYLTEEIKIIAVREIQRLFYGVKLKNIHISKIVKIIHYKGFRREWKRLKFERKKLFHRHIVSVKSCENTHPVFSRDKPAKPSRKRGAP